MAITRSGRSAHAAVHRAAADFKLLSATSRLRLLWSLGHGEESLADLGSRLGLSPSVTSNHLKFLLVGGMVEKRRGGKNTFYRVTEKWRRMLQHVERIVAAPAPGGW